MLRLYDTQTREVRDFVPLEEGKAGLYVCGLTVQSEPHVGHVRSAVNFDVLQRWLRKASVLEVVDTAGAAVVRRARLGGSWSVETLSKDGKRLYALQYLRGGYLVRRFTASVRCPPGGGPPSTT